MKKIFPIIISIMLCLAIITGCGSRGGSSYKNEEQYYENNDLTEKGEGTSVNQPNSIVVKDTDRKLTYSVSITIKTKNYDDDYAVILKALKAANGYISQQSSYGTKPETSSDSGRTTDFELRIPTEKLDAFLDTIDGELPVYNKQMSIDDISDYYYDTESRIELLENRYNRIKEHLDAATEMEDIITLEEELSNILYELDNLKGTRKHLDNMVNYSTVSISINEIVNNTDLPVEHDETLGSRILSTLKATWRSVVEIFEILLVIIVGGLPLYIIIGVIIFIIVLIVNKGKKKKKAENK